MHFSKLRVFLILISLGALIGCANGGNAPGVPALKYLFVVDQSANNQQNYLYASPSATPVPDPNGGTDPTGNRRYSILVSFLESIQNNSNTFYSALFFNTTPLVPFSNYTGGGASEDTSNDSIWYTSGTKNTTAYLANQITNIWCPSGSCGVPQGDGGFTDYHDTLIQIMNSITQDAAYQQTLANSKQLPFISAYVIYWVSSNFGVIGSGIQSTSQLLSDVQNIMSLKSQQNAQYIYSITFNTGYYSTNSSSWGQSETQSLLSNMSSIGNGTFLNFGSSNNVNYSQFPMPSIFNFATPGG